MKRVMTVLLALAIVAPGAVGQTIEKGDSEVQVYGTLLSMEGMTMAIAAVVYGYYVTPNFELGIGPNVSYMDTDYDSETNFSGSAFFRYTFTASGKTVPYINGQWYQYDFSPPEGASLTDMAFVMGGGGLKVFVNEYVAYDFSLNYGQGLAEGSSGLLIGMVGISVFF